MAAAGNAVLGLIAGEGALPLQGARQVRASGRRLVCVAFRDLADPSLAEAADEILWIQPGEVARGLGFLREQGVAEAVLAGQVAKRSLLAEPAGLGLDATARALLGALDELSDATLLDRIAGLLERAGIALLPQWCLDASLRAGAGLLGGVAQSAAQQRDIDFGFPIARAIAAQGIGQSIVVKRGVVLAVEALEGTDAMLRRAGELAPGGVAIKVAKPDQDARFDLPAIGPRTVETLASAGIAALAFEADMTLLLSRERLLADADAAGIAVVGVAP